MTDSLGAPKTYEDYLNSPDDGLRYEVIDGEFVINPACSIKHQTVLGELLQVASRSNDERSVDDFLLGPVEIRLKTDLVLQPDLAYVRPGATSCTFSERGTVGPPTIIFEIVAPWTSDLDWVRKRDIYESHGVEEYWIVDPDLLTAMVLTLVDGKYVEVEADGQMFNSVALPRFCADSRRLFNEARSAFRPTWAAR